jgi:integrase
LEYVNPIRDLETINAMKMILRKQSQRDLLLFVFGINTGIRVSDLLSLKMMDVREENQIKEFLFLKDEKSGQTRAHYINHSIKQELEMYLSTLELTDDDYLFRSKKNHLPITRQQAYRIIHKAAEQVGIEEKIGMHTLRKTFGYHAYRKGIAISIIMDIFHHQTPSETLRYIGINKQDQELIKVDINL